MLHAGVAQTDITPKEPLLLAGYPSPEDRAGTSTNDPLYCSAFYLKNEQTAVLFVTLDLVFVTKTQTRDIRQGIQQATGMDPGHIAVSCTHTHSGPITTSPVFDIHNEDELVYPDYMDEVVQRIIQTATRAVETAFEAQVGFQSIRRGKAHNIGGNRHHPDGPADDELYALGIRDAAGHMRGILTSYSLHPTLLHADSYAYSADFPGYMRMYLESQYPGCVFGFQMGTSGNQSTRHFRSGQTFEEAKRYGDTLGAAAQEALGQATFTDDLVLKAGSVWVTPDLKDFPPADQAAREAAQAQQNYDEAKAAGIPYTDLRTLEVTLFGANIMANMTKRFEEPGAFDAMMAAFPFEIQAIRVGDLVVVLSAGELFVEIGLAVKKQSPFPHTYMATASNGLTVGYVVTPEAHEERGYEALGSVMKPSMAAKTVEEALKAIDLVR